MDTRESYFRLWDEVSSEFIKAKKLETREERQRRSYNYDLCDGLCLEFGI